MTTTTSVRAPTGRYVLFGLVATAQLAASIQGSMISVAFPNMINSLDAPLRWVSWVITIFTLSQAISMPIAGRLSDEIGRRTVFAGGLAIFTIASLACALAPNVYFLIAARAVQGFAGGSLLPSAYGIIGDAFSENRSQAIGFLSAVFPIGAVLGPNVGGLVVDNLGWRWTFGISVPLGIVVTIAAFMLMQESRTRSSGKIDYPGAAWLGLGLSALIYGITEISRSDADPSIPIVAVSLIIFALSFVLFIRREMRCETPVMDLTLLRQKEFAYVNALNFLIGVAIFGLFSFIPLYAQEAYGVSSSESGALVTPRSIMMVGASSLAAFWLPRTGYHKPIIAGIIIMASALFLLSAGIHSPNIGGVQVSNFVYLSSVVAITGLGFGIANPGANNAAIELAPERIAAITGIRGMFRFIGGAIGASMIVLVTSHSSSVGVGLERSFFGLAIVSLITIFLVFGIPESKGRAKR